MSFGNFFSHEKTSRIEADDYKITNSKKTTVIVGVISLLLAIIIWASAVVSDSASYAFNDVTIQIKNAEKLKAEGYEIVVVDTVNFKVTGRTRTIMSLDKNSVVAYIDLTGIKATDEIISLDVQFDSNYRLWYSDISSKSVNIKIVPLVE